MTSTVHSFGEVKVRRTLASIIVVAIVLRLLAAFLMGNKVIDLPGIHDQISYDALARSILAGRGYSFTENWYPFTDAYTPTAHWSFVYPLYLAGVYALFGLQPVVARIIQGIVGGALICLLVFLIGRKTVNEVTGLVGAGLTAVYGYFVYYNVALMTETFFITFVLCSLYLSLSLAERPTIGRWVGLGLALGIASLLRQTMLLFIPFLFLWLFYELRKGRLIWWHFAIPVIVISLLITPWLARNYMVYGQFPLLNSNAGYAFYASNNPSMGNDWSNELVVVPVPDDLRDLNEGELNSALTRRGLEFVLEDPGRYLLLTLDKTLEYIKFWPSSESVPLSNVVRVLSLGLYLPFMVYGLYLSASRLRRFTLLYLFMAIHTGIHLLSWPSLRYRLPVDAVLMIFAAMALLEVARLLSRSRRIMSPAYRSQINID